MGRGRSRRRDRTIAGARERASSPWATWFGARWRGTRRGRASWRARWRTGAGRCAGSARARAGSCRPRASSRSPRGWRRTTPLAPSTESESAQTGTCALTPRGFTITTSRNWNGFKKLIRNFVLPQNHTKIVIE